MNLSILKLIELYKFLTKMLPLNLAFLPRYDNGHDLEDLEGHGGGHPFSQDIDPNQIFQAFFGGGAGPMGGGGGGQHFSFGGAPGGGCGGGGGSGFTFQFG